MSNIAISLRSVNSWKAASMVDTCVSWEKLAGCETGQERAYWYLRPGSSSAVR